MKCKHKIKYHKAKNYEYEECHGWYTSEYDIYCSNCGKILSHWAYGSAEPEYIIKYELKGFKKIKVWFDFYILRKIQAKERKMKSRLKKWYDNFMLDPIFNTIMYIITTMLLIIMIILFIKCFIIVWNI